MKYEPRTRTLELTTRNIDALLMKLDDPLSVRTLSKDGLAVTAVESRENVTRKPSQVFIDRDGLVRIRQGQMLDVDGVFVLWVPDDAHYSDRAPGEVYMPSENRYY